MKIETAFHAFADAKFRIHILRACLTLTESYCQWCLGHSLVSDFTMNVFYQEVSFKYKEYLYIFPCRSFFLFVVPDMRLSAQFYTFDQLKLINYIGNKFK